MTNDEKPENIFENLFGKDERSDEEREADQRTCDENNNERFRVVFEKERDRRSDYLAMDQRIRGIVSSQINALILTCLAVAAVYAVGVEYGKLAGLGVVALIGGLWWWESRKSEKHPRYKIEEVDELAEDTVTHERILAYESDGKPWLWSKGQYLYWDGFFDHPYWEDVNKRVRLYSGQSHKQRVADNQIARTASLPFRKAMLTRLREQGKDWELPYWARLDNDERNG